MIQLTIYCDCFGLLKLRSQLAITKQTTVQLRWASRSHGAVTGAPFALKKRDSTQPFLKEFTMLQRRQFTVAGFSALAAAATWQSALKAAQPDQHSVHYGNNEVMKQCAKACSDCQLECNSCAAHCAMQLKEGHTEHAETLATCQDCADVCIAASQIVSRGGPFANLICKACADACSKCAASCKKFPNDQHMMKCAIECLKCEKACREMLPKDHQ